MIRFCLQCLAASCEHSGCRRSDRPPYLNQRQVQIATALMDGTPNKRLAYDMGMAEGTVKVYLTHAFRLIREAGYPEVVNRTALAAWALKHLSPQVPVDAGQQQPTEQDCC